MALFLFFLLTSGFVAFISGLVMAGIGICFDNDRETGRGCILVVCGAFLLALATNMAV